MYLVLFGLWLLFNGSVTLEITLFGLAVTAMIGILTYVLFGYTPRSELTLLKKIPYFSAFAVVLLWEIVRANFTVLGIIMHPEHTIRQSLVVLDTSLTSSFTRFLFANSITLTPGTITVKADGSRFTVHCLSGEMLDGILEGRLYRLLLKLEA